MHLERLVVVLQDLFDEVLSKASAQIPELHALTHLSLPSPLPMSIPVTLLEKSLQLQLLLFCMEVMDLDVYWKATTPYFYDGRLVIILFKRFWTDWEYGAKGLPDSWARREDLVARKQWGRSKSRPPDIMVPRSAYGRGHAPRADQPGLEGAEEDGGGDADEHAPERGKSGRRDEDVEANQGVGGTEDEAEAFTALDCIEDGPTVTAKDELKAGTQHAVQFRGHTVD
ncbi:hypothetical protein K438DRAFT_1977048 [Mycena galopus ATCC 62051]|nr:hypothetical protein K438DRAFT_1977048 [Mycena galopus ATCC 62051]